MPRGLGPRLLYSTAGGSIAAALHADRRVRLLRMSTRTIGARAHMHTGLGAGALQLQLESTHMRVAVAVRLAIVRAINHQGPTQLRWVQSPMGQKSLTCPPLPVALDSQRFLIRALRSTWCAGGLSVMRESKGDGRGGVWPSPNGHPRPNSVHQGPPGLPRRPQREFCERECRAQAPPAPHRHRQRLACSLTPADPRMFEIQRECRNRKQL